MGKTHFWVSRNQNDERIRIVIEDATGRKIEEWIVNLSDNKGAMKVFGILKQKYGFDFSKVKNIKYDRDMKWLRDGFSPF